MTERIRSRYSQFRFGGVTSRVDMLKQGRYESVLPAANGLWRASVSTWEPYGDDQIRILSKTVFVDTQEDAKKFAAECQP
ncbi:MAG: hypothetical protein GOVbin52_60 [Prokaryotic dsDNA virus sp.]|nr:MAG: hypothetical protein GOVbin52_60 [Prokaryotic dsDNA virus sp.]HBX95010.1 hypothetical protein [Hyphomonas sp.]|tara:strand:+ start:8622 stop:8861 length:240 start_codon:yes stop_codon:yes gene_type:complete